MNMASESSRLADRASHVRRISILRIQRREERQGQSVKQSRLRAPETRRGSTTPSPPDDCTFVIIIRLTRKTSPCSFRLPGCGLSFYISTLSGGGSFAGAPQLMGVPGRPTAATVQNWPHRLPPEFLRRCRWLDATDTAPSGHRPSRLVCISHTVRYIEPREGPQHPHRTNAMPSLRVS